MRRASLSQDADLLDWINDHLPSGAPVASNIAQSLASGLILYRVAEFIKGRTVTTDTPDSDFSSDPADEKLEGMFKLFDFLADNDVKMGSVSINDVRQGNKEKITQLVRALKNWEEKRKKVEETLSQRAVVSGPFLGVS